MIDEHKNIDKLISDSIENFDLSKIPVDFTERLSKRFEYRNYIRNLLKEWSAKILLIIFITACCGGIYYYYSPQTFIGLVNDKRIIFIISFLLLLLVIFLFDQLLLKILFKKYDKKM